MKRMLVFRAAASLTVATAGGALFSALGIPLPWMLGSLTASAIVAVAGLDWALPVVLRDVARPMIGVFAGSAFTLAVLASIADQWLIAFFLFGFLALITVLGYLFFTRLCGLDSTTAFFASTPGGLGELSLLGALYGGQMRTLVLIHAIRVVTVAVLVPFTVQLLAPGRTVGAPLPLAGGAALTPLDWLLLIGCAAVGYGIGRVVRITNGVMLFPMILSAAIHVGGFTELGPPPWLVAFMQVIIGSVCGSRFAGIRWEEARSTVVQGTAWAAFMLLAALLAALAAGAAVDAPLAALLLAFSPGGFAEVVIVAYAIGIDVAFVVSCQVFRIIVVLTFAPPVFRLFFPAPPDSPPAR